MFKVIMDNKVVLKSENEETLREMANILAKALNMSYKVLEEVPYGLCDYCLELDVELVEVSGVRGTCQCCHENEEAK